MNSESLDSSYYPSRDSSSTVPSQRHAHAPVATEANAVVYTHPPVRPTVPTGYLGYPRVGSHSGQIPGRAVTTERVLPVVIEPDGPQERALSSEADSEDSTTPPSRPDVGRRPNAFIRGWRKLGGGSLAFSIGVHLALIILAGVIVMSLQPPKPSFEFRSSGPAGKTKGDFPNTRKIAANAKLAASLARKTLATRVQVPTEHPEVVLPAMEAQMIDLGDVALGLESKMTAELRGAGRGTGGGGAVCCPLGRGRDFVAGPNFMKARCSATERLERLREAGGSPECEAAVSRSLAWLKSKQNADGSWGRANRCAMTGLSLLCYLGRCETPDSPFYGDTVTRGIMYLLEAARRNEDGFMTENPASTAGAYEHGIATYALGEMYAFARLGDQSLPGMREAFEKGVKTIIRAQNSDGKAAGSWDYYTRNVSDGRWTSSREDLSVTGWQYQALKAAKNAGLRIDGLHAAIERCVKYLERKQTKDGGIGGASRDAGYNQWSLTGAGVLGLQTLGDGKKAAVGKGMKFLHAFLEDEPLDWNRNCNLYCWYYYTQAFFQAGGAEWKFYNSMFLPQVLAAQSSDGSFKRGRANMPIADAADEILRQTLATLQLEVYYRYLRVADKEEGSVFER